MAVSEPNSIWDKRVVPTARAVEMFFWRLAWFTVVICVLSSYNPFNPRTKGDDQSAEKRASNLSRLAATETAKR